MRRLAASVDTASSAMRLSTDHALFTWGLLPGVYHAPEATPLQQTMRLLGPAASEIDTGLRAARAAIETLADDLEVVNRRRDALVEGVRQHAATAVLDLPESIDPFGRRLRDAADAQREASFRRDCAALVEGWDAAASACVTALRAIPDVPWALVRDFPIDAAVLTAPSVSILDEAALPLLQRLAGEDAGGAARLLRENPRWVAIIRRGRPEAVAEWWSRLPSEAASALVSGVPALIGNLDGVGLSDRVAANRARAAAYLSGLRAKRDRALGIRGSIDTPGSRAKPSAGLVGLNRELAYLEAVAAGHKQLYAWDPRHGSLIEMAGDPSTAKSALFVVPGTNTTTDSFYGENPVTRFANWQAVQASGAVVSFTVMTGPMPQLSPLMLDGPQLNTFATKRAPEYSAFIRGVSASRPDLWTMSYEHSYAGAIGSAAESYGGTVDARFMAAAVGAVGPYVPSPDTAYYAAQGPDDINRYYAGQRVGYLGFGITPESFPGVEVVDTGLPGFDPWKLAGASPLIVKDSIEHHNALMSDDEKVNGPVLKAVRRILAKEIYE
ncbi:hypothetical protein [Microbacterium sp. VKM Ac-2923]|uniref:hypothetical protein n=1 Tax=Microbacterium sp. VKM Ac-2923 TaxID=2929476 RepID=UPI001FB48979|nr:hypothetical protein [Microbacterium sp. VKM Ac-2923]